MVALVGCLLSACACVAQTPVVYSVENVVDGWLRWLVACFLCVLVLPRHLLCIV